MDKQEKQLKLYHDQILVLIKSLEGKNLAGKIFRSSEKVKNGWRRMIEDIALKMANLDENSSYLKDIRQKIYGDAGVKKI
ncbi:MAG: hypothetical protein V1869_02820 [Candidatus Omnitrophota bacterium]